ncbi:MAG: hypothetical protein AAGI30_09410 [Planctomycetota bacterium]
MNTSTQRSLSVLSLVVAGLHVPLHAQTISLASTMDPDGFISENAFTQSYAQISEGDGSLGSVGARTGDTDGLFLSELDGSVPPSTGSLLGTAVDLFPREADFVVGDLTFDASTITGVGVETVLVDAIDLSELWSDDPNRTAADPNAAPTVVSDISDFGLGLWFFDSDGEILFGDLDANDTVTFTDGVLTSIDIAFDLTFTAFDGDAVWSEVDGFSISGSTIALSLDDSPFISFQNSRLQIDLTGTVGAVGSFVIPAPGTALPCVLAAGFLARRRR